MNQHQPLWMKPPAEVTPSEYASFYQTLTGDFQGHVAVKHFSVEGKFEFRSILYIPEIQQMDFVQSGKKHGNIKVILALKKCS